MSTYCFKGKGAALPYDSMFAVLRRNIDLPSLIATNYGKLALASAPTVSLTSFSGFVQNDIMELWEVPAGTVIIGSGCRVTTAEGATAAATLGFSSATQTALGVAATAADPNAYGTFDLNSVKSLAIPQIALDGTVEGFGDVYVTDGSIDLKFTTNDTYAAAIFDVWVTVFRAFEPTTSS
jgi:hypothetical protein